MLDDGPSRNAARSASDKSTTSAKGWRYGNKRQNRKCFHVHLLHVTDSLPVPIVGDQPSALFPHHAEVVKNHVCCWQPLLVQADITACVLCPAGTCASAGVAASIRTTASHFIAVSQS
jgi:hypothetical protein